MSMLKSKRNVVIIFMVLMLVAITVAFTALLPRPTRLERMEACFQQRYGHTDNISLEQAMPCYVPPDGE